MWLLIVNCVVLYCDLVIMSIEPVEGVEDKNTVDIHYPNIPY